MEFSFKVGSICLFWRIAYALGLASRRILDARRKLWNEIKKTGAVSKLIIMMTSKDACPTK
jgi:hypothetical protein